jgi:coenzyme PQQ synthesis protein D (PqqD)
VLIHPEDIDDRTVPVPATHVAFVPVDDGGVIVDEAAGRGYAVNASASLLWTLLDAVSPLGAVVDDVSDVFGAPREEVQDRVHATVRFFAELGLFNNVTRRIESVPIDVEYVDLDECGEPVPPGPAPTFDERYVKSPPNA